MKTKQPRPLEEDLKDTALEIVINCISYTAIKKRNATGNLTDRDIIASNIETVNKIYTYLYYNFKCAPDEDVRCFLEMVKKNFPANYPRPELDRDMMEAVERLNRLKGDKNRNG